MAGDPAHPAGGPMAAGPGPRRPPRPAPRRPPGGPARQPGRPRARRVRTDGAAAIPPGAVGPGAGRGRRVSTDARPQGWAARGRLRIYLGYAPGAGATCALLSEDRQWAEHGTDVVVARAETHGRPHTEDLLAGLEVIPSLKFPYRGTLAEDIALSPSLAPAPP